MRLYFYLFIYSIQERSTMVDLYYNHRSAEAVRSQEVRSKNQSPV